VLVLPASTLIAGNVSVTAVAPMLGHTVAECFETYAHCWPSENYVLRRPVRRRRRRGSNARTVHEPRMPGYVAASWGVDEADCPD
jgi:hypothetical protein